MNSPYDRLKTAIINAKNQEKLGLGIAGFLLFFLLALALLVSFWVLAIGARGSILLLVLPTFAGFAGWSFFIRHDFKQSARNLQENMRSCYVEKTRSPEQRVLFLSLCMGGVLFTLQILIYAATNRCIALGLAFSGLLIFVGIFYVPLARVTGRVMKWIKEGKL